MIITINCDEVSDNIDEAIEFFVRNKLNHIELRSINKKNLLDYSFAEIKDFKKQLIKKRLKVVAIASPLFKWFYDKLIPSIKYDSFFFNPILSTNQKKQYIEKTLNIAELLETDFIRIFSNLSDGTLKPDIFWNDELLGYALEQAKKHSKYLLLENEPICTVYRKNDIKRTFRKINNPNFKLWMDIANFYQAGDFVHEKDIQDLRDVIKYVHLKDIIKTPFRYVPLGEGEINYKRILTDIRKHIKDEVTLSIETHVRNNKIQTTLTSLNKLRSYLSQKRTKYAVVGAGRISQKHGFALTENDNSELRGIFDINKLRKSTFAQKYDAVPYRSLNELLNDKTIDVVNICTPHDTHIEIAEKAVANNKKVLCEKPFALSSKSLLKTLHNKKIRNNVFVVFQNNFNPPVELLYRLVKEHKLGKINYFSVNLRWWRGKEYYSDWHGSKKQSGGLLFNQAIHSLGVINRILELQPDRITTYAKKIHKNLDIEDLLVSLTKLKKGQLGNIEIFLHATNKNVESSIFISGTKGTIKIGGIALDRIIHLDLKEKLNNLPLEMPHTHPYGNGHSKLIEVLSDYLLGIDNPKCKLLVHASELKRVIRFIESLYSNISY